MEGKAAREGRNIAAAAAATAGRRDPSLLKLESTMSGGDHEC
jgi:hypothetical protein